MHSSSTDYSQRWKTSRRAAARQGLGISCVPALNSRVALGEMWHKSERKYVGTNKGTHEGEVSSWLSWLGALVGAGSTRAGVDVRPVLRTDAEFWIRGVDAVRCVVVDGPRDSFDALADMLDTGDFDVFAEPVAGGNTYPWTHSKSHPEPSAPSRSPASIV